MRTIYADKDTKGQRLDKFLLKYMNDMPKSFLYKMLRKKNIKLNGKRAQGSEIINDGDKIDIYIAEDKIEEFIKEEKIEKVGRDFSIIYEDENIIVCNKPSGLIVQGDNENNKNSLNSQLIYYMHEKGEYDRESAKGGKPSICNRLDRNTSGIVLFGKKFAALQAINEALKETGIDKYYMTIAKGNIDREKEIRLYHKKENNNKVKIADKFFEGAKETITIIKPVKKIKNATLCEVKLITGKTHQIRAVFD
ncbi:MAG: RluA family pseudouridine synthase [Firmicutes bacterium]|nr:RluA family pseudouridine synthase [Bacillota bacterium]